MGVGLIMRPTWDADEREKERQKRVDSDKDSPCLYNVMGIDSTLSYNREETHHHPSTISFPTHFSLYFFEYATRWERWGSDGVLQINKIN